MTRSKTESLSVGASCAAVGLVGASLATAVRHDPADARLIASAVLSAFASGLFWWAFLVARCPNASRKRAAVSMAAAAVAAHFLTWALFAVVNDAEEYIAHPVELLKIPFLAVMFGAVSLAVIGWLTIPLGVGIGLVFLRRRQRSSDGRSLD
jgi:hypothetical protein